MPWRRAVGALAASVAAGPADLYTTNIVCSENNCINPIFPGLEDMQEFVHQEFTCSTLDVVAGGLDFCADAIDYHPALPIPSTQKSITELVKEQEQRAVTAYFFHLGGMGREAWDATQPWLQGDPCLEAIWRLACWTMFPRSRGDCKAGEKTPYLRPCESSCINYVKQCQVECCDESVECVFEHTKALNTSHAVKSVGYVPELGPSSICTGAGGLTKPTWILVLLCAMLAGSLTGCDDVDVPTHRVGAWRT